MKSVVRLVLFIVLPAMGLHAQTDILAKFAFRSHTYQATTLPYRLFVPDNYSPQKSYPLVLALHGSGERGTDNVIQAERYGLATSWAEPANQVHYPCIVAVPQCPPFQDWNTPAIMSTLSDLLDSLAREFSVDTNRLYLTGLSMGGFGTYGMIEVFPERFAAAVPMSAGWGAQAAPVIQHVPIWNFHGARDDAVPVSLSREIIGALEDIGRPVVYTHCRYKYCTGLDDSTISMYVKSHADLFYTEYEWGGHEIWLTAYSDPHLIPWVFDKYRQQPGAITLTGLNHYQTLTGTTAIAWVGGTPEDSVEIWLSPDAGERWVRIVGSAPNTGSYSWDTEQQPDCAFGILKVFLRNSRGYIYSQARSGYFSINNAMNGVPFARILNREFYYGAPFVEDSLQLSVLAGDAEGGQLSVGILYSPDGGREFAQVKGYLTASDTVAGVHTIDLAGLPNSESALLRADASDGTDSSSFRTIPFVKRTPRLPGPDPQRVTGGGGTLTVHVVDPAHLTGHLYRATIDDTLYGYKIYNVIDADLNQSVVREAGILDGTTEGPVFDGLRLLIKDYPQTEADLVHSAWRVGAPTLLQVGPYLPVVTLGGQEVKGFPYPADYTITFFDHVVDTSSSLYSEFPATPVGFRVWNQTENRKADFSFVDGDGNQALSNFDEIYLLERDTLGVQRLSWGLTFLGGPQTTLPQPGDEYLFATLKPLSHRDVFEFRGVVASVPATPGPQHATLEQNYPNPFNPATTIRYQLPAPGTVRLAVYDLLGREVAELVNGRENAGAHEVRFDGSKLASGVYFCRLTAGEYTRTRKLLLIR